MVAALLDGSLERGYRRRRLMQHHTQSCTFLPPPSLSFPGALSMVVSLLRCSCSRVLSPHEVKDARPRVQQCEFNSEADIYMTQLKANLLTCLLGDTTVCSNALPTHARVH